MGGPLSLSPIAIVQGHRATAGRGGQCSSRPGVTNTPRTAEQAIGNSTACNPHWSRQMNCRRPIGAHQNKVYSGPVYVAGFIREAGESALQVERPYRARYAWRVAYCPPGAPDVPANLTARPFPPFGQTDVDFYIDAESFSDIFAADVPSEPRRRSPGRTILSTRGLAASGSRQVRSLLRSRACP
jgi:hypothetical protein